VCSGSIGVVIDHHELLTLIVPSAKVSALSFLRAATFTQTTGTWRDPMNVSHDRQVANVAVDVEYGETSDEMVGRTIMVAIRLLNLLEVNEQVLYARSIDIEDSTLLL